MRSRYTAAILIALSMVSAVGAPQQPSFLFILADDQRWDALGAVQREQGECGRFPWFKTPNLDRIASEGVRFRNAFVTLSLCAPSRSVFLTDRYSTVLGTSDQLTTNRCASRCFCGIQRKLRHHRFAMSLS